jgi:DNA invertase Pin-like site-specific DNA recombinase
MKSKKLKVAYVRLSEDDVEKKGDYSASIYNQLSLIKDYAKKMGFEIEGRTKDSTFVDGKYRDAFVMAKII